MVTTRSQSVSPRKKSAPINYADSATITPSNSPRKRASSSKRATSISTTSSSTKKTPRRKSMVVADEIVVKSEDDEEHVNGNGVEKRSRSSRKVPTSSSGSGLKGKPAHKVDKSGHFEFGGTFGTTAMMLLFPVLMYYLWICTTFYGGSLQFKRGSETWPAFADRMVAHVTKVSDNSSNDADERARHPLRALGYFTGRLSSSKEYSTSLSLVSKSKAIHCDMTTADVSYTIVMPSGHSTYPSYSPWGFTSLDFSS